MIIFLNDLEHIASSMPKTEENPVSLSRERERGTERETEAEKIKKK